MLVEVELQALVGIVDAQLLKRVLGQVLEAEDIQDADALRVVRSAAVHDGVDA